MFGLEIKLEIYIVFSNSLRGCLMKLIPSLFGVI